MEHDAYSGPLMWAPLPPQLLLPWPLLLRLEARTETLGHSQDLPAPAWASLSEQHIPPGHTYESKVAGVCFPTGLSPQAAGDELVILTDCQPAWPPTTHPYSPVHHRWSIGTCRGQGPRGQPFSLLTSPQSSPTPLAGQARERPRDVQCTSWWPFVWLSWLSWHWPHSLCRPIYITGKDEVFITLIPHS